MEFQDPLDRLELEERKVVKELLEVQVLMICRWMPKLVLEQFQQDETCCFTLANQHKDLIVGKDGVYATWLSHSKAKLNAVAVRPSKHILHISKTHNALVFENSLYKVDDVVISP